jgi:hypothetical protein
MPAHAFSRFFRTWGTVPGGFYLQGGGEHMYFWEEGDVATVCKVVKHAVVDIPELASSKDIGISASKEGI